MRKRAADAAADKRDDAPCKTCMRVEADLAGHLAAMEDELQACKDLEKEAEQLQRMRDEEKLLFKRAEAKKERLLEELRLLDEEENQAQARD